MSKRPNVIESAPPQDQLTREVVEGLRRSPKELSPVWFYDEVGSLLFDSICELPEYYVTRTEVSIMQQHAAQMAEHIGPRAALIEFGSGTSTKTRQLLDNLEQPQAYVPVDIARDHLREAAAATARNYPLLPVYPVCADFTQPFELPRAAAQAQRRVVYFPGSTLGNFTRERAGALLTLIRRLIGQQGALLIGIDLRKDPAMLRQAYNDAAGVTAEFNLNALRHLNRELRSNFDVQAFRHQAVWVEEESRIEMHLISTRDQVVYLRGERFEFRRDERMRTECCHKYTLESFAELAAVAGLGVIRVWMDPEQKFSVQLLEPLAEPGSTP